MKKKPGVLTIIILGVTLSFISNFFLIYSCSLFLKNLGSSSLPYYYIALNIFSIMAGSYLIIRNVQSARGLITGNLCLGAVFIAVSLLIQTKSHSLIFVLYTITTLYYLYSMIMFWNLINSNFSIVELKRYAGMFSAGIFLGTISAGLLIRPLLDICPDRLILIFAAFLCLLISLVVRMSVPHQGPVESCSPPGAGRLIPTELFQIELIRLLIIFTLIFVFVRYLVDFEFLRILSLSFRDAKSLSGFLGSFTAIVYTCIFIWQALILPRALKVLSLTWIYAIISIIFLVMSVVCIFHHVLFALVLFQGLVHFLIKSFKQPAQNILIKAVTADIRSRANFLLCGISESLAVMTSGVIIACFGNIAGPAGLFFIFAFAGSLVGLLMISRLRKSYVEVLVRNIKSDRPGLQIPWSEKSEFQPATLLDAGNRESIRGIMALLRSERDPSTLSKLVRAIGTIKENRVYLDEIAEILKRGKDPALITQCIETLAMAKSSRHAPDIIPYISHESARVRATAITFTMRLSADPDFNEKAVKSLVAMVRSSEPGMRAAGVSVQGELGLKCFSSSVGKLLLDTDSRVRKRALIAALKLRSPSILPALHRMAEIERNSAMLPLIDTVISRTGDSLYEGILSMTEGMSHEEKQKIRNSLLMIHSPEALEPVSEAIRHMTPGASVRLIEAIAENSRDVPFLQLMNRCFEGDSFSFIPLLLHLIDHPEDSKAESALFSLAGCEGRFPREYAAVSQRIQGSEIEKCRRLLLIGLMMSVETEHASLIYDHIISREEGEDLSIEIAESAIEDKTLKEAIIRLIHLEKSA